MFYICTIVIVIWLDGKEAWIYKTLINIFKTVNLLQLRKIGVTWQSELCEDKGHLFITIYQCVIFKQNFINGVSFANPKRKKYN